MPPRKYSQNKDERRGNKSIYTSLGPSLSEYEKMLSNNPGPGRSDSWVVNFMRSVPLPGVGLALSTPVGEALLGKAERPIKSILEAGEDAPVIGPAIGAVGRGMDLLSRGNYAAANVAQELQGDPTENVGQDFLEQLRSLWQVGASIPGLALPDAIAEPLGLRNEDVGTGDIARAAWEGLSGKEKTIFSKVLGEQGVENNFVQGAGGFGLDVALDPTTYIGSGVVKGATKGDDLMRQVTKGIGAPPGTGFTDLLDFKPPVPAAPVDEALRGLDDIVPPSIAQTGPTSNYPNALFGPEPPPNFLRGAGPVPVKGEFDQFPRQAPERVFEPQNPLSPSTPIDHVSPVGEVGSSGISDEFLQGELPFGSSRVEFDPIQGQQINLFDKRRKGVKAAIEGSDLWKKAEKVKPVDQVSSAIDEAARMGAGSTPMGQLAMQFPDKAEEIKWLQLFDPDMPQHVKKSWKPSQGVELRTDAPEPWEIESLIDTPARAASDDWEVSRQLYLPDGPVDIPVSSLASNQAEGLIKAPYEVPGIKGETNGLTLPRHREMMSVSDEGARLAEPNLLDVGDLNKPWSRPGSGKGGGFKGPRYNPGKLPGAGSAASEAPGYVALRFAGVDIARSHGAYRVGRSVFRPFYYGNGVARTLGKAFNMGAHLPDGLDQMFRVAENNQMAHFDRNMRAVTGHLGKLPLEERRQIGRAIADGTNLSEFRPSVITDEFSTAEDYRQLAKGIFDEAWNAEHGQNIAKGPYVDNYFHRQILNEGKLSKDDVKYAKAKNADGTYKHSVQALIDRGIEIELDVNKVLVDRLSESARKLTRADFQWQAIARFGVPEKHVTKEMAERLDLVPIDASIKGKEFRGQIYAPRHINEAMNWTSRMLASDEESAKFMKHLDRVVGEWKYLALATPGRHVRDVIGDIIMNAQANVWNVNSYRKASKVLGMQPPGRNHVAKMDEAFVMSKVLGEKVEPHLGEITIAGQRIPIEAAWDMYVTSGAKAGQLSTEISRLAAMPKGRGEVFGGAANVPGRVYAAAKRNIGRFSDTREDWARLAHVIDYFDRKAVKGRDVFGPAGDLTSYGRQLADEAGKSVRKWNIDYGNLTPFERNVVRRAIPFYTFMRHNMPRQLELLFTKPGFMSLYPKGNNLLQGVFGTESGDDTLLPNWIRESAPFRLQHAGQEQRGALGMLLGMFGAQPGQQVLADPHSFTTPIGDFQMLNAPFDSQDPLQAMSREIGSRLTPLIKVPAEIMTGNKVFNGAPIDGNYLEYMMEQLPQGRAAHNIFEGGPGGQEGLMRMATGLPIRGITENMMDNEAFRRKKEAERLFQDSLSRHLPAQYRGQSPEKQREIYRNLMRAQDGS